MFKQRVAKRPFSGLPCGGEQVTMEVTTALDTRVENCRVRFFGDGRAPQCIQCSTYAC